MLLCSRRSFCRESQISSKAIEKAMEDESLAHFDKPAADIFEAVLGLLIAATAFIRKTNGRNIILD